jgi:hypothetical protein
VNADVLALAVLLLLLLLLLTGTTVTDVIVLPADVSVTGTVVDESGLLVTLPDVVTV